MIYCIPVSYSLVTTNKNPINSPETLSKSINRQYQDKHSYFCMFSKYQSNCTGCDIKLTKVISFQQTL